MKATKIRQLLSVAFVLMAGWTLRADEEITVGYDASTFWLGPDEIAVACDAHEFRLGPVAVSFTAWAAERGLSGADAAWDAKPVRWGGTWQNGFIYTYGEGLADGSLTLMRIGFDADGKPVITTTPVIEGHNDFTPAVIGSKAVGDWAAPTVLENIGDDWRIPAGKSANFFRVRLGE